MASAISTDGKSGVVLVKASKARPLVYGGSELSKALVVATPDDPAGLILNRCPWCYESLLFWKTK